MKFSKFLTILLLLGVSSCALKKEYVIGDNKRVTAKKIVKNINDNKHEINTFQLKYQVMLLIQNIL